MMSSLSRWKQFYQQLGSLVELTHIDLRTISPDDTALFVADDPKVHQLYGFSSHAEFGRYREWYYERRGRVLAFFLSGLTKLRELRGSVSATTEENERVMKWLEVRWMADHWPNLEAAEFFEANEAPRGRSFCGCRVRVMGAS